MIEEDTHQAELDGPWTQALRLSFIGLLLATFAVAIYWSLSGIYLVPPQQTAVVYRFGAIERTVQSGLLITWPSPIERVQLLPAPEQLLELQVMDVSSISPAQIADQKTRKTFQGPGMAISSSLSLLSGDAGAFDLDIGLFYQITDASAYALNQDHVIPALGRLARNCATRIATARDLDTILVARPELVGADSDTLERRARLHQDFTTALNQRLEELAATGKNLGIHVVRSDLQARVPAEAVAAFDAVLTASQNAEKALADARTDAAKTTQEAAAEAEKIIQQSFASASETKASAMDATAEIMKLGKDWRTQDPDLLQRLYRTRMTQILNNAGKLTIVPAQPGTELILQGQ